MNSTLAPRDQDTQQNPAQGPCVFVLSVRMQEHFLFLASQEGNTLKFFSTTSGHQCLVFKGTEVVRKLGELSGGMQYEGERPGC